MTASQMPQVDDGLDDGGVHNGSSGDSEYWRREWDKLEDENATVDADVHGCVFTPFQGQMNRKQRIFTSLARQLVGLPAPSAPSMRDRIVSSSESESRASSPQAAYNVVHNQAEELSASREADKIIRKGEAEQQRANRGSYSEMIKSKGFQAAGSPLQKVTSADTIESSGSMGRGSGPNAQKNGTDSQRTSWSQANSMSQEEMLIANSLLMSRLQLFMATPSANVPVSAFFYNQEHSRQKTVYTDAAGHFALRAALDFTPTHVRVLAGEDLSATEEVTVIEPRGVSLISDIDDTIKHSAIGSGAREIFRNAFTRELGDLTIDGVSELYNSLSGMGVHIHYVSNSPWQMFPVLKQFFSLAGLPPGSFHLKQYSGMLQGIFEPVAERKKGTLDRLASDFPERQFILVGDSGEAALEVYTEFALENPGRVLAVFIRDITTSTAKAFFDSAVAPFVSNAADETKDEEPRSSQPSPAKGDASQRRNMSSLAARSSEKEEANVGRGMRASGAAGDSAKGRQSTETEAEAEAEAGAERRGRADQVGASQQPARPRSTVTPPIKPSAARVAEIAANEASKRGQAPSSSSSATLQRVPPAPAAKPTALRGRPADGDASTRHLPKGRSRKPVPPPPQPRRQSSSSSRVALVNATSSTTAHGRSMGASNKSSENSGALGSNAPVQRLNEILSSQSRPHQARSRTTSEACDATSRQSRTQQTASRMMSGGPLLAQEGQSAARTQPALKDGSADESDMREAKPPALPPRRGFSSYSYAAAQMVATKVYGAWAGAEADGAVNGAGQARGGIGSSNPETSTQQQQEPKKTGPVSSSSSSPTAQPRPPPPPPPPRRLTSSPSPASSGREGSPPPSLPAGMSKKEEMWRRRWTRAQEMLKEEGVVLRSWRVGTEVTEEAKRLVCLAGKDIKEGTKEGLKGEERMAGKGQKEEERK